MKEFTDEELDDIMDRLITVSEYILPANQDWEYKTLSLQIDDLPQTPELFRYLMENPTPPRWYVDEETGKVEGWVNPAIHSRVAGVVSCSGLEKFQLDALQFENLIKAKMQMARVSMRFVLRNMLEYQGKPKEELDAMYESWHQAFINKPADMVVEEDSYEDPDEDDD